jgi:hypothetical protein
VGCSTDMGSDAGSIAGGTRARGWEVRWRWRWRSL